MSYQLLAEVTRVPIVESQHEGALAIVSAEGELLAAVGDPLTLTYPRSSLKPLQALSLIESGAADHYQLTSEQLAIACASHGGTPSHTAAAASLLAVAHRTPADLRCGEHPPMAPNTSNPNAGPLGHNCSGKHAAMLVQVSHTSANTDLPYTDPHHPLQVHIRQVVAEVTGYPLESLVVGIDGCSVPNFALPLHHMAHGIARFLQAADLPPTRAQAATRLADAMRKHPDLIAWEGSVDTRLMRAIPGLLSKGGAEGYQVVALPPGLLNPNSPAIGLALKIADGTSRARACVVLEALAQLGLPIPPELDDLHHPQLFNWRKLNVGELRPVFQLQMA